MTIMAQPPAGGGGGSAAGALYAVIELILDRGLVIDVFVRVSVVGIELLTIDARVVVASIDTYLRFAEACNRLDLTGGRQPVGLPTIVGQITENSAQRKVRGDLTGGRQPVELPTIVGQITENSAQREVRGALTGAGRAIADTTPGGRDSD